MPKTPGKTFAVLAGVFGPSPTVITVYELAWALGVPHLDLLQPDAKISE